MSTDQPFYATFNSAFFLSVGAIIVGCITLTITYCYRAKCIKFACCGLSCERNIDAEQIIDMNTHDAIPTPT